MPLPLIPAGIVLAGLLGYGGKKGLYGVQAMKDAKAIGESAEARHKEWVRRLDEGRSGLQRRVDALGLLKERVVATTFRRLFEFLKRLEQRARLVTLESLGTLRVSREEVRRFAVQYVEAGGVLSGAVRATLTGPGRK